MSDPGPPVLVWLPLLHRIASVENGVVYHETAQFCSYALYCFSSCTFHTM